MKKQYVDDRAFRELHPTPRADGLNLGSHSGRYGASDRHVMRLLVLMDTLIRRYLSAQVYFKRIFPEIQYIWSVKCEEMMKKQ